MIYGYKLKELREKNNLTQINMAEIINVDRSLYGKYEREYIIIPINHLIKICDYFNISLDYLFELNINNNKINETNPKKAGERLKEFRKEFKITQEQLAKILNTNRSVIANYERGRNYIATPFLYMICKKYNVSADYLLGKTNEPKYLK